MGRDLVQCLKEEGFLGAEIRGTLGFLPQLEMRPSSKAPNPVESRFSLSLQVKIVLLKIIIFLTIIQTVICRSKFDFFINYDKHS